MPRDGLLRRSTVFLTLASLAALPCLAPCQAGPPNPATDQTTVVNVNEATVDLVARSKNGKLVQGLQPQDITVTDGGTPVKISSLRLVTGAGGDHLLTLVFDRLDMAGGHNARDIAGKILKMVPQVGFSFCVTKAQGRLMLYQDFTSDRRILTDAISLATDEAKTDAGKAAEAAEKRFIAIARTGSDETGTRVAAKERNAALMLLAAVQESQNAMQELHTQPGLAGLMALARAEQRIPGRKTVLYFAQGLQSDAFTESRLRDIVGAANRAGVSIYVIDANALTYQADQGLMAMTAIGNARSAAAQQGAAPTTTGSGPSTQTVAQPPAGLAPMVSNQIDRYESAEIPAVFGLRVHLPVVVTCPRKPPPGSRCRAAVTPEADGPARFRSSARHGLVLAASRPGSSGFPTPLAPVPLVSGTQHRCGLRTRHPELQRT